MDLPIELKIATEKMVTGYKIEQLKKITKELTEKYRNESGKGKVLLSKDIEAAVYAIVRMPATYAAVSDALKYSLEFFNEKIETLLDIGAGSGAATWAVYNQIQLENITCIEREKAMRKIGETLMKDGENVLKTAQWINADLINLNIKTKADLVVSSYVMNEMAKNDREKVLDNIWKVTNKMLLIIEPGTPEGFNVLKDLREYMLKKGAHIIAPCTHEEKCRISDEDWCHFTCRVQRSKIHKLLKEANVPYEDEKYTYMAFVKEECSRANARILRHPYIEKGNVSLEVCMTKENKKVIIKKKDDILYKLARKSKHGDSIDIK